MFEKHFSLLFGRASNMQDFDIDARFPALSTDPAIRPWDESFIIGIKLAKIQSEIYDRLYSITALKTAGCERKQYVNQIATTMQEWEVELRQVMIPPLPPFDGLPMTPLQIDSSQVNNRQVFDISRDSWDIMYYSTVFEPDFLQDFLDADSVMNHAKYSEAHDIFDCWVTGLPAGMDLFGGVG